MYIHKSKYKQEFVVSCQQHSSSRQTMTLNPELLTYGAKSKQPPRLFSGLPTSSPALESFSNINAGPKALS